MNAVNSLFIGYIELKLKFDFKNMEVQR